MLSFFKRKHHQLPFLLACLDLLPVLADGLETLGVVDSEDYEEPLPGPHVLVPHGAVLLLPGGVEDVEETGLSIYHNLLPVAVLYSRVVLVDKMVLDQLNCQCRFPHASS